MKLVVAQRAQQRCLYGLDPHKKGCIVLTGAEAWGIQLICLGATAFIHSGFIQLPDPFSLPDLTLSVQERWGEDCWDLRLFPGSSQALLSTMSLLLQPQNKTSPATLPHQSALLQQA